MVRTFEGSDVPMPTFTPHFPVPPSTNELLWPTTAWAPIAVAFDRPLVLGAQLYPTQVRSEPVVLDERAAEPTAVFSKPEVLLARALYPTAVFAPPESAASADQPTAVFSAPSVLTSSAYMPTPVL